MFSQKRLVLKLLSFEVAYYTDNERKPRRLT